MTILIWLIACYLWFEVGKFIGRRKAYMEILKDLEKLDMSSERLFTSVKNLEKTVKNIIK